MSRDIYAERRAAWAQALRSGRYKQGRGALRTRDQSEPDDTYCCLGVACEVAIEAGVQVEWIPAAQMSTACATFGFLNTTGSASSGYMPVAVAEYFGMLGRGAFTRMLRAGPDRRTACDLVDANDSCEASFHEIAELVTQEEFIT